MELTGEQFKVMYLEPNKHNVVLGVAGSGKTLIAILRAKYLANLCKNERVLLTTYNTALDRYFYLIEEDIPENLDICVYHKFARGYLNSIGKMSGNCILDNKNYMVERALYIVRENYKNTRIPALERFSEIFAEEITWIEKMGIMTLQSYIDAERIGRGKTRIKREDRKYFFEVYQKYLEIRKESGYLYDWDDIAITVRDEMIKDTSPKYYKHIIIDEGQDFSPVMIQSLANSIPEDGSLTFFGDVAQQIYGSRYSWRDAGIKIGTSGIYKFKQNYRNSKEIFDFANDIRNMPYWNQDEDILTPNDIKAEGPKPILLEFSNLSDELNYIIKYMKEKSDTESIAILLRNNAKVYNFLAVLIKNRIRCQMLNKYMTKKVEDGTVFVGTYHSSKGLEFDTVFLPCINQEEILPAEKLLIYGMDEVLANDTKLFYVAVTRAKRGLIMSYSDMLTQIFPKESNNYDKEVMYEK